jgi:Ca-activated chloride channel family protein
LVSAGCGVDTFSTGNLNGQASEAGRAGKDMSTERSGRRRRSFPFLPGLPALPAFLVFVSLAFAQEQQPTYQASSSELVVLPVVVTDRAGAYVSGLTIDQFVVYDNGRRQPVSFFSTEDTPVSVAVVIDASGSMRLKIGQVMAATMAFARASNPDDELFVIEFNDRVRDAADRAIPARDPAALEAALWTLKPTGQTALYDALLVGLNRLERASWPRKILIAVSDGGDNASRARLDEVVAQARRSNVTIYTIGLFDRGAPDTNPDVLEQIAEATGGQRHLPASPGPLMTACQRIAREIRSGYTLGYIPPDRDGAFHLVRVAVEGPTARTMRVRTRPGYFAAAR